MKNLVYLATILVFMSSCVSSEKYLANGQYDLALEQAVKKLSSKPNEEKQILVLEKAYTLANQTNLDKIKYLRTEGSPDSWDEILKNYERLKNRQNIVRPILPLQLPDRTVNFERVDYDQKIVEAKQNAADFYYEKGKKEMAINTIENYRNAWSSFNQTKSYFNTYKDIDQLMSVSKEKGTVNVNIYVENRSEYNFKQDFYNNLLAFGVGGLDSEWARFYTNDKTSGRTFHYSVKVQITSTYISPEKQDSESFIETKKVQDGFEYDLDANGNVKKDSTGKDIKKPKFKDISCKITKTIQSKTSKISCDILFISNSTDQVVKRNTIEGYSGFRWEVYTANGDVNALKKETRDLLNRQPKAFPANFQMIEDASSNLHSRIKDDIKNNTYLFK